MTTTLRTAAIAAITLMLCAVVAAEALAQTSQTPATRSPGRAKEFMFGGSLVGPTPLGSAPAELLGGSGNTTVTQFRVKDSLATGFGVHTGIGVALRRSFWIEVAGAWTRSSLKSRIADDFEDADDDGGITSGMSRFQVEASVVRYFRERGARAWFVRAGAGWMRETAGGNTLTGDGVVAGAGIGLRHWWRTAGKGSVKRAGIRLEGRADVRSGGIDLGDKSIRFGPAAIAQIVFGY